MKITKHVFSLLVPGVAAAALLVACGDDDSSPSNNNARGSAGAPTVIVEYECPGPGESFCNGSASGVVCAKGSTSGVPFSCAQGEVCEDGACVGQCEAGATECVGERALRACSADGKQWVPVACQPGEECVDGACEQTGPLCEAGEKKCDGDTLLTCKGNGSGWTEGECPADTQCTDGACVGVCTVGETRCDPSTDDLALAMFNGVGPLSGGGTGSYGVLWKCVDGTSWELESCGAGEFCSYSGVEQAEVDRYKRDLLSFSMGLVFAEGSGAFPSFPTPPAIPAGAQASCTPDVCGLMEEEPFFYGDGPFAFFETAGVRACGAPGEEGSSVYSKLSSCSGLPPYQAFQRTTVECPDNLVCVPAYPEQGCVMPECDPEGPSYCDGNYRYYCDPYSLTETSSYCDYGCTTTGTEPNTTGTCDEPQPL